MASKCELCTQDFFCGARAKVAKCWCFNQEKIAIDAKLKSCICPRCFAKKNNTLKCFRLKIAYLGRNFCGSQYQENGRSVEGELKKALFLIHGQQVKITAAGRTDSGVNAHGQVVSIQLPCKLNPRQLCLALQSKLPSDIGVISADLMPLGFDARRQSLGKQYIYQIYQGLCPDPLLRFSSWHISKPLDINLMNQAASFLVGEHDFSSFRSSACLALNAKRCLWHLRVVRRNKIITIDIRANAFCLNMVRIIVGTLVDVGRAKIRPQEVKNILDSKDRKLAGMTVKAHGLSLYRVFYPDSYKDALIPKHAVFPRYPVNKDSWPFDNNLIIYGPS